MVFCVNFCEIKLIFLIERCVFCVISVLLFMFFLVILVSLYVVEISLILFFDDGFCVMVDVGFLFFLYDVV